MGALDILQDGLNSVIESGSNLVTSAPLKVASGVGAVALVGGGLVVAGKKSSTTRKKKTSKGISRDRKFKSKQKHEQKYKRKKKYKVYKKKGYQKPKSTRKTKKKCGKVYYTCKGQPYKILASGKARFIKGKRRKC